MGQTSLAGSIFENLDFWLFAGLTGPHFLTGPTNAVASHPGFFPHAWCLPGLRRGDNLHIPYGKLLFCGGGKRRAFEMGQKIVTIPLALVGRDTAIFALWALCPTGPLTDVISLQRIYPLRGCETMA